MWVGGYFLRFTTLEYFFRIAAIDIIADPISNTSDSPTYFISTL